MELSNDQRKAVIYKIFELWCQVKGFTNSALLYHDLASELWGECPFDVDAEVYQLYLTSPYFLEGRFENIADYAQNAGLASVCEGLRVSALITSQGSLGSG